MNLLKEKKNLFDPSTITPYKRFQVSTGLALDNENCYITDFVKVNPGDVVVLNQNINSDSYGHNLYYANKTRKQSVRSATTNMTIIVPDEVYYMRFSGRLATIDDFVINVVSPLTTYLKDTRAKADEAVFASPEIPYAIKEYGTNLNGFNHCAFPHMCYFGGNEIISYHCSKSHRTPINPTNWGGNMLDKRTPQGVISHIKFFTKDDFTGLNGEIRDTMITPSRDGQYLLMSGWTTYYDANDSDVHYFDNLIVCLNSSFEVVDYLITPNTDHLYWGNLLETPDGHLLITAYAPGSNGVITLRSEEVFNGTVSGLTMTQSTIVAQDGTLAGESCLGYYNDKLVVITRRDTNNCVLRMSANLEGTGTWSEIMTTDLNIHAPKLLPYYKGDYLPFWGALYVDGNSRLPIFGYYDTDESNIVTYGNYAPELPRNYGGYAGIVSRGAEIYDVVYYRESPEARDSLTAQTGLYFKRFNARELLTKLTYLL